MGDLAITRLEAAVRHLREATVGREPRGLGHDDADDVIGTGATDDAMGFDPLPLLRALPCEPAAFSLPKVLFRSAFASGDCCTPALPWGDLPVAAYLARCQVAAAADGLVIRYLDRADLIQMRRAVGRPKDLRRASELSAMLQGDDTRKGWDGRVGGADGAG